jgi:DNA-binding NarL/FixJ family response regulator
MLHSRTAEWWRILFGMSRILVIEDATLLRENIIELLKLEGYSCEGAESAEDGLRKIRKWKPDLILCDIKMPANNGYWVLEQVKADVSIAKTPFIFITAKVDTDEFRRGMAMGADDYITKPFTNRDLLDGIKVRLKRIETIKLGFSKHFEPKFDNAVQKKIFINEIKNLTKTEKEILSLIVDGFSSSEIAQKRFNSVKTIENHRANIISKLGLRGHLALIKFIISIDSNSSI